MTSLTSRNTRCPRLHHQMRGGRNRAQDHRCASNRYSGLFKSRAHPALSHSTQAPPQGCVLSPLLPALLTHDCTPSHTSKLFISLHNCVGSHQPIIRNESRCRALVSGQDPGSITQDLSWSTNISSLARKPHGHFYFLFKLRKA